MYLIGIDFLAIFSPTLKARSNVIVLAELFSDKYKMAEAITPKVTKLILTLEYLRKEKQFSFKKYCKNTDKKQLLMVIFNVALVS